MTPAPTPQPDHGAAGFCTDHGQAASCPRCAHPWHMHRLGACEFDWIGQPTLPCGCDSEPPETPQQAPDERTETVARVLWDLLRTRGAFATADWPTCVDTAERSPDSPIARRVRQHRDDVPAVVAALDDESARLRRERDAARQTIHRMDYANITALRETGVWEDNLGVVTSIHALASQRDAARAALDQVRALAASERGGRLVAGEAADRFRDVLAECLGHPDENPGDDVLVAEVRAHFDKTGPEPHRWRDFCSGALAVLDQISAMPDPAVRAALDPEEPR